jgi:SAM-dependent methyltransferase
MLEKQIINPRLLDILRCPSSGLPLKIEGDHLVSVDGSQHYPVVRGIPCLIPVSAEPTHEGYRRLMNENRELMKSAPFTEKDVADYVQGIIVGTCGNLFRGALLQGAYPIPEFPKAFGDADMLLDVGCNWGRWSIAGARAGYRMIGIDIQLKSLLCSQWLSQKLTPGNEPLFVLADARHMPFAAESFSGVFSYSVIQHFSKTNASIILSEVRRIMKPRAKSLIQMPNKMGIRSGMNIARRGSSNGSEFDVRFYSTQELVQLFESRIGKTEWTPDCFFGLNVHRWDRAFIPVSKRWIIDVGELLLSASNALPIIGNFSDSVFLSSTKS